MPPLENKEPEQFDLGLFFELSPDFLCIAGFDGYFKKVNPALIKTLGYTEEELFAKPINDFIYAADKDVTNKQRESIKNGSTLLNFENRYVTKNGDSIKMRSADGIHFSTDGQKLIAQVISSHLKIIH